MGPQTALPLPAGYTNTEEYVEALLHFVTFSDLFQLLVGGVHILDFFARSPDLYEWLLDAAWRQWFELHELQDLLDFFLREDMGIFMLEGIYTDSWRGKRLPPESLIKYIAAIRDLSLARDFRTPQTSENGVSHNNCDAIPRHTASGMNVKKKHEVDYFVRYVQKLTVDIAATTDMPITHIVDFGSGQNYLGRTLASPPYNKQVIAVESKPHNVARSKKLDIFAKIAPKPIIMVNKKQFRAEQEKKLKTSTKHNALSPDGTIKSDLKSINGATAISKPSLSHFNRSQVSRASSAVGSIQYVHHKLEDGKLAAVVVEIFEGSETDNEISINQEYHQPNSADETRVSLVVAGKSRQYHNPNLMVISLHSCGNLSHHGLRSLVLNPSVSAVCLVGCCYNLVTERLSSPTYKLPSLRPTLPSDPNSINGLNGDPHGFPMSARFCHYLGPHGSGVHFNITARMMAVQAPQNWGPEDSEGFFKRHFYRALLQKIFLDRGVVQAPARSAKWGEDYQGYVVGGKCPKVPVADRHSLSLSAT